MAGGYSGVTISIGSSSEKPIEGSVNITVDEDNSTELRYEGGEVATGTSAELKVTMEWKVPGMTAASRNTNVTATLNAGNEGEIGHGSIAITGTHLVSPSWDTNWGCVTIHKVTGKSK